MDGQVAFDAASGEPGEPGEPGESGESGEPGESGRVARLTTRVGEVRAQATDRATAVYEDELRQRIPAVELVVETGRRWLRANGAVLAGHLAFRLFLFIVPMFMLAIVGFGVASESTDINRTADSVGIREALANDLVSAGEQTKDGRLQIVLGATFTLLLTAWGLLGALRLIFAVVWGVKVKEVKRSTVRSLLQLLAFISVFLAFGVLRQTVSRSGPAGTVVSAIVSVGCNAALAIGLSWILPRRVSRLRELLPGALVTGVTLSALNIGGGWYFSSKLEKASDLYGAVGTVVVVLSYLFFAGEAIVLGAVANTVAADRDEILGRDPVSP